MTAKCQMSRTSIGGAIGREFKSEALNSREQFSFQTCLKSGDGSRIFGNWRQFQTAGAMILNASDWKLILDAG